MSDELAAGVDELVDCGLASSRSDAVRSALERWIDSERRRRIGEAIVEGYRRVPQTDEELAWADSGAAAMIAEEPW